MTAPPRSSGCSGSHHSSALQSPELHTRIYSASVNNSPGARSAMTGWKPATQASTDRRTHGPEVEILNLVDGHPRLQDHGHRRRLLLARRRNHGGGIQASNGREAQWSGDVDRDATSPARTGAWH